MSYINKIRNSRVGLSKSFSKLANFILDSYIEAAFMTATDIAQRLDLDAATVVRFSQHLGYTGYPELLEELRDHVKGDLLVQKKRVDFPDSVPGVIAGAVDDIKTALEQTLISLDSEAVNALVEKIGSSRRILVVAEGAAQPAAYNLAQFLEQGKFPITIARPGLAGLARALNSCTSDDLLIAIDIAREAPYIAPALREARGKGVATAAIAGSPSLPSTNSANIVLTARTLNKKGTEVTAIEALIYALTKVLQRAYPDRFEGAERSINELSSLLQ